jgi:hypothetical protein
MPDAARLLTDQLKGLGRAVLQGGGSIIKTVAEAKAALEFTRWQVDQQALRHQAADDAIAELARTAKSLPKGKKPARS